MPHINSIRLVNVHFNNATQFYDDFRMDLAGKNTTYDLENGGGKSLLLQMILQTVLPKAYLRKEKPVSLLFQGGKDRTSHVAVDWILDEGSSYQYLLTGFSARKRKSVQEQAAAGKDGDDILQSGDIEHLSWCVFHNDERMTGIKKVPLVREEGNNKIYAGFDDIRKYIIQVRQKGLPAETFESISEYQDFIAGHNLIPAEWNIIRGINSGENNIESYFRQNATSRKLIEDLFIKIIEDVEALNRGGKSNDESLLLADALIEIRGNLNEYLKRKSHMSEYERIKEYYQEFEKKNEALYAAIKEYEKCRIQAPHIRNLIGDMLKKLKDRETETSGKIEINADNQRQAGILKKQLEAGLVKYHIGLLEAEKNKLETEKETRTRELNDLEERYALAKALEEYGEYRRTLGNLLEAEQSLKNMEKDSSELEDQYREAGGKLRFLLENEVKVTDTSYKQLTELLKNTEDSLKEKNDLLLFNEKKASGIEVLHGQLKENEKTIGKEIKEIQDYFIRVHGELEAVSDPVMFLQKTENETQNYQNDLTETQSAMDSLDSEYSELELEIVKLEAERKQREDALKSCEDWLSGYERQLSEMKNRAEAFGENTPEGYRNALELLIHDENLDKLKKEIKIGRLKQKKDLSEARGYYVPNEEIIALSNELSEKCEYVQEGIDWLARLSVAEKESTLEKMPYLPYSVIVDSKSFNRMRSGRIRVEFTSDYPVPVINVDAVRNRENPSVDEIIYLCSFSGLILENSQFEQYIKDIDIKIENLKKEISLSDDRINGLSGDLQKVSAFLQNYTKEKVQEVSARAVTEKMQLQDLNETIAQKREKRKSIECEKSALREKVEKLNEMIKDSAEKEEKLRKLIRKSDELRQVREQLGYRKKELDEVNRIINDIRSEIKDLENRKNIVSQEIDQVRLRLYDSKKELDSLISFDAVKTDSSKVEVQALFNSLSAAISGRLADEERLRREIEDYRTSLSRLTGKVLRDYGKNLAEFEKREAMGERIEIPSSEQINKLNSDKKTASKSLKSVENEMAVLLGKIGEENGRLSELTKDLSEGEREKLPLYESEDRYREEISLTEQIIISYADDKKKLDAELTRIKEEITKLNSQAELYDSFILQEEIENDGETASEIEDYLAFMDKYQAQKKKVESMRDDWTRRLKAISQETVNFIIREPLEELAQISPQVGAAQCLARREAFREYIANIEEQIEKILGDIRQLESYQENFTRRCVQRAELVLGHLRKIESLSRIDVYGMRRNIIELAIPEFDEKEKYHRMNNHINNIIKEIDEKGIADRKTIALKLATKELLAQITDMDKAAVRLYKIESIPENSRYYRWERAVGSEGQNNALYFIFAASLISFIRILTTSNAYVRTKKVIIADNPFGATSAVYLWQPMFDIMKQNDIQLIAPGHKIPREITSKFSVNYLLNQEILEDGRTRVVVKDVRTETDEDMIKFIEPEQLSMFQSLEL
jgi:chromosome segregation ATPase